MHQVVHPFLLKNIANDFQSVTINVCTSSKSTEAELCKSMARH